MIIVIDNYDSFTYNLVQYIGTLTSAMEVYRNDKIDVDTIREMQPDGIVISPGPGRPEHAGITVDLIRALGADVPILGICLGMQAMGYAYGASIVGAPEIVHGKTSVIHHTGDSLFHKVTNPFKATRYHSLMVDRETLPREFVITAETDDKVIMGLSHRTLPMKGVQFHPESIVTEHGMQLIQNFIKGNHATST